MAHNSREKNLRFKIAFTETNIRYLLGENPVNQELIDSHREAIREAEKELAEIKSDTRL